MVNCMVHMNHGMKVANKGTNHKVYKNGDYGEYRIGNIPGFPGPSF